MRKVLFLKFAVLIAIVGLFTIPSSAQKEKIIGVDRDGEFHFDSPTRFGGKTIKKGMYRIYQVSINGEHFIIIRKVAMNRYGKSMSLKLGEEVARSRCTEGSADNAIRKTKILVRQNEAKERIAMEVWFRGESIRHILLT
ncbi:MAG: DUF2911 domain-containing protein [Pyrinomonadaceae bacterium]|nr:DUF2911 domain-containing protein [Pyrinomonadaceae bacterium]